MAGETACSADGCTTPVAARGLCMKHYKRIRRNGHTGRREPQDLAVYMLQHTAIGPVPVERPDLGPCHLWTGSILRNGYGKVGLRSEKQKGAHRAAYELTFGPIPEGLVIDHLCRVRACVNPAHMEPVTDEENLRRGDGYRLQNGRDTACIHGHEYTPENTYINPNDPTDMRCRTCARLRDMKRRRAA